VNELASLFTTIFRSEDNLDLTGLLGDIVLAAVLVTESVSTNNDRVGPAGHESGDVRDNNGFTEDSAVKDVADGTVGGLPHLLKVELLHTALIGGNRGALNTDLVLEHSLSTVNSDLIISGVARLDG